MKRQEKSIEVAELGKIFASSGSVVVAHYKGINVAQINGLRKSLREAGGCVRVAKNRLVKIAVQGTDFQDISSLFSGQSLIVYGADPIVAPKASVAFSKDSDQFIILGGVMDKSILDEPSIQGIASLQSLDEIRAKILGSIQMSASKLVRVVNAPAARIVRVLSAYVDKNQQK
ncbi:50S ribosomal protein L10 [Candidatus Liberibacter sp.]|uniref:50S ribosomal protein L10 n=1 Tax=Candidatus Liberibacter sp. TaxID=34022 RepID=UPI0015F70A85|nr:50S ribosomal protein L10 [Candidatus Liberibacter sp.]MBA5724627.1 50S ribosomal protein L10 [Candidatus Liberibacter sp.]